MSKTLAANIIKTLIEDLGPICFMDALQEAITDNEGRVFEFSGYRKPNDFELDELKKYLKLMSFVAVSIETTK